MYNGRPISDTLGRVAFQGVLTGIAQVSACSVLAKEQPVCIIAFSV
jgi:hypothetical protein